MIILPDISPYIQGREAAIQANWQDRVKFEDVRRAQNDNLLQEMGLELAARLQPGSLDRADVFSQYASPLESARTRAEMDILDYAQQQRNYGRRYGPALFDATLGNLQGPPGTQPQMGSPAPSWPPQATSGAYTQAQSMNRPATAEAQTTPEYFRRQGAQTGGGLGSAFQQMGQNAAGALSDFLGLNPAPNTAEQNMAVLLANAAQSGDNRLLSVLQSKYPDYDWVALQQQAVGNAQTFPAWFKSQYSTGKPFFASLTSRPQAPAMSQYPPNIADMFPTLR